MSKKHKKVYKTLNYIEHLLILAFAGTGCWMCFSFYFCFFNWYYCRNYEFCSRIRNLCNNRRNFKNFEPMTKKRKKKHEKIALLPKAKLHSIHILISMALINLYISHYELVSVDNVLKEYDEMKEKS